jgi:hypothetical protein
MFQELERRQYNMIKTSKQDKWKNLITNRFASPIAEYSFAKGIPMDMLKHVKKNFPGEFRYRYRGPSTSTFKRSPYNTIMEHATSFAIYYK